MPQYTLSQLEVIRRVMLQYINKGDRKFSYALQRNLQKVDSCSNKARRAMYQHHAFQQSEEFVEYVNALHRLEAACGTYGEDKQLVRDAQGEIVPKDFEGWAASKAKLEEYHKEAVSILHTRKALIADLGSKLFEVEFYKVMSEEVLPETLSLQERANLAFMLNTVPEEVDAE